MRKHGLQPASFQHVAGTGAEVTRGPAAYIDRVTHEVVHRVHHLVPLLLRLLGEGPCDLLYLCTLAAYSTSPFPLT